MNGQTTVFRIFMILVALVATVILWWVSWQAWIQWDAKEDSYREVAQLQQKVVAYKNLEVQYESFKSYKMVKARLDAQLDEKRLLAQYWDKRNVRLKNEDLTRAKVQDYLLGLGNENRYVFVPSNLVIQTLNTDESMFSWKQGDADRLRLTLEGDYYMRREK